MAKYKPMVNLTAKRRMAGITQKKLAAMLGLDNRIISSYETGKCSPSVDRLESMAAALDCEARDLI